MEYDETLAPVAKLNTIRVLFIVGNLNWPLQQLDIKNVFLHGYLEEEVFMSIPPRFKTSMEKRMYVT